MRLCLPRSSAMCQIFHSLRFLPKSPRPILFRHVASLPYPEASLLASRPCLVLPATFCSSHRFVRPAQNYRSEPLAMAIGVASLASPAWTFAFAAFWPIGVAVNATSSFSIFSRVVRVSSSTSAALRWAVGIGGSTIVAGSVILASADRKCTGRKP